MRRAITKDQLDELTRAYRLFFSSREGLTILSDLMKFCSFRAPIAGEKDEGKRQVFLHILEHSQLTDEQLIALYAGRMMMTPTERQND